MISEPHADTTHDILNYAAEGSDPEIKKENAAVQQLHLVFLLLGFSFELNSVSLLSLLLCTFLERTVLFSVPECSFETEESAALSRRWVCYWRGRSAFNTK